MCKAFLSRKVLQHLKKAELPKCPILYVYFICCIGRLHKSNMLIPMTFLQFVSSTYSLFRYNTFSQVFLITFMSWTLYAWTKNPQEKVISFITDLNANDIWINAFIVSSFGYLILLIISSCFCLACRDWENKSKIIFILNWICHLAQIQYIYEDFMLSYIWDIVHSLFI